MREDPGFWTEAVIHSRAWVIVLRPFTALEEKKDRQWEKKIPLGALRFWSNRGIQILGITDGD